MRGLVNKSDDFYLDKEEPNKGCLLALRSIILSQDENVNETRKWGAPCFCFGKKMFCFLMTDKKTNEPYILFVEGKHLDNPILEVGNRTRMKILRIDANHDLPIKIINELLDNALNLYRNGVISYE